VASGNQSTVLAVCLSDLLFYPEDGISTSEAPENFCQNYVVLKKIEFFHI
jgi:hypothetical protein